MYWLIIAFTLSGTGEFSSMAVKFSSMDECEKKLPDARKLVEKSKSEIGAYAVYCTKVESTGEAS